MITKTFKITITTDTEEQMRKEEEHLSMIYGAEEIEDNETGKWLKIDTEVGALGITYNTLKCSRCGWSNSLIIPRDYCPRCGIKMEVEEDE